MRLLIDRSIRDAVSGSLDNLVNQDQECIQIAIAGAQREAKKTLTHIRTVQALVRENVFEKRYRDSVETLYRSRAEQ